MSALPPPMRQVTVPRTFSPSRFDLLRRCPVAAFAKADAQTWTLPRSSAAWRGLLEHHVRHDYTSGRWGSQVADPSIACRAIFDRALKELEAELADKMPWLRRRRFDGRWRRTVVRTSDRLAQWAQTAPQLETQTKMNQPRPFISNTQRCDVATRSPGFEFGSEVIVHAPKIRVSGRADLIRRGFDGAVEVLDYKSGTGMPSKSRVDSPNSHTAQLALYALAIESIEPNTTVRLYLQRDETIPIDWNDSTRANFADELSSADLAFPSGHILNARDEARPGPHCRTCRLRPGCASRPILLPSSRGRPSRFF